MNIKAKKVRTVLTVIACSIGIVGVGTIASVASGLNSYITEFQNTTLSQYPITVEQNKGMFSTSTVVGKNEEKSSNSSNKSSDEKYRAEEARKNGRAALTNYLGSVLSSNSNANTVWMKKGFTAK